MSRAADETNRVYNSYKRINGLKNKFGEYKKVEFHLHTPASHDYKLFNDSTYRALELEEIILKGIKEGLLTEEFIEDIKNRFSQKVDNCKYYDDLKELIAYCLVAMKLYKENIEVAIVCDHNTVDGFNKMEYASNICHSWLGRGGVTLSYLNILFGVEIGCSEENHLICIQDRKYLNEVKECLNDEIINCKEGSYRDSLYIMQEFWGKFKSVCYLAHQNTANNYGSGAYKKQLYSQDKMCLMGTTDNEAITKVKDRIKNYIKDKEITFVYEGDSHDINSIGIKNTWIKMKKSDYNSFLRAVRNRNITIKINEPKVVTKQIKGMLIMQDDKNFLSGDKDNKSNLIVNFSPELNCIIGGRGTGKSTILNLIDISLSKQCRNIDNLIFICKNKCVDFLIEIDNREFIITFIPQIKDKNKYYYLSDEQLLSDINIINSNIELGNRWITGYEIINKKVIAMKQIETDEILRKLFRRSYNVNKLVNLVENNKIEQFLDEVISYGISNGFVDSIESKLQQTPLRSYKKFLRENINRINDELEEIKMNLTNVIKDFNDMYKHSMRVVLEDDSINSYKYLKFTKLYNNNSAFQGSNLTWGNISKYIFDITKKVGYFRFLHMLLNGKYMAINKICNIYEYVDYDDKLYTKNLINNKNIKSYKLKDIFKPIEEKLFKDNKEMNESIIGCLKMNKQFSLEFNINNKERVSTEQPVLMKNIKVLSLGQKVVALLSFVFEFGKFSGDNSVLIIDQPEDNLDNQYIYKNLVSNLKNIKNERQVIVVTHSSTIVTNADAEQVIVMESDNKKAWIAKSGYPEDKTIIEYILNNLEGGIEAFKHKKSIYNVYIK